MMPTVKERLADIQGQGGGRGQSSIFSGAGSRAIQEMGASFGLTAMNKSHAALPVGQQDNFFMFPTSNQGPQVSASGGQSIRANKQSNQRRGMEIEAANVSMIQPFFHTPGNAQDAYNLPKSYVDQIRWSRLMYNLNAYIGAITDLLAYYPYSKFDLSTPEPFVTEFYTGVSFTKNFNLYKHILRKSLSMKKFGEAISWGSRKQDGVWPKTGKPRWIWDNFILLEPELVEIKKQLIGSGQPQFFLRPSRDLQEMVEKIDANDRDAADYRGKLGAPIMEKIRRKELVPIDPSTISAIQNLTDASAVRGTPPYQRLFVTFIYEDFIRLSQMAQAQRYHFPVELWTLGDLDKNILPNPADLQNLRDLVTQAIQTPPFAIFFPPILKYEALGVNGKLLTIKADYEYIWQQYTVGMGVSENMILGEAEPISTIVPTPKGFTTMGELKVGDEVFAKDGSVTTVVAMRTWKNRPCYAVSVDAAEEPIICDENHKWLVGENVSKHVRLASPVAGKRQQVTRIYEHTVLTTKYMKDRLFVEGSEKRQPRYAVPMHGALDLAPIELPFPPYTLGVWLGDGSTDGLGGYTCDVLDAEIIDNIRAEGFDVVKHAAKHGWGIHGLAKRLKPLGVGKKGAKFLPEVYLRASFQQRLAVVQGLMDTDGYVQPGGTCHFYNTNLDILRPLRELLLTLGFKVQPIKRKPDNRKASYLALYILTFTPTTTTPNPFRLTRKAAKVNVGKTAGMVSKSSRRAIHAITRVEDQDTKCIQVAHPSGTYLTGRDFVVTHNSGIFSSTETSSNQAFIRSRKKDRDEMEEWMRWQFYEPLARWNNLKIKKGDQLVPILPDILWEKTLDFASEERDLKAAQTLWDKGVYPTKRLLSKNRENPDEIEQELKEEIDSVFDDGKRIAALAIREAGKKGKKGLPGEGGPGGGFEGPGGPGAEEAGGGPGGGGGGAPPTAGVGEEASAGPESGAAPEAGGAGEAGGGAGAETPVAAAEPGVL
jgi:hypothetical protein